MQPPMTIELADFFVFRTPLLPFSELTEWARGLRAPAAPDMAALEAAIADDRRLLLERLREVVVRPVVREALFLASPSLHDRLPAWTEHADKGRKVEQALVKYFTRMAARATPFGLFAGNTVATSGPQTHLLVEAARTYKRRTRLDCEYLSKLTDALGQDPTIRNAFAYRPNSSLYRMAGQLRCIRIASAVGGTGALSATTATKPLEATLARAAKGAHPGALADSLVSAKVSRADADKYLESLVRCQILVSELAVPATGAEPLADLVGQLSQRPETTSIARVLERVRTQLAALDAAELGLSADTYRAVAKELEPLPVKAELGRLFQVDMVKPSPQARLGARVREELARGTELLHRIAGMPDDQRLLEFCRAFERRYGDREMPLCAVLDEELGIGFDSGPNALSPLLSDLDLEQGTGRHARPPTDEPQALSLLAHKVEDALRAGAREICLDETDLRKLERKDRSPLPDAGAVFARLAAASDEALDAGDFLLHIGGASGPSGANLLGRFCHGDEMLTRHVRRHLADEEARHPDVLFAEVVHIPQARLGNVTLRPLLRSHEIAYLGRSGAPEERHIAADDLLVSVRGERVILRSRRLGREIAPRLTSAHNHSSPGNLAMYRFLCALQTQGVCPAANFDWGALNCLSFLPRVRAGRIVLSLARWIVSGSTLKALGDAKGAGRYALVQELRRTRNLPRWVAVADWDNELPIDLDNTLSIDTFVAVVKDRANVALTEVFEPEQLCARGPEGRFVHELVVPFLSKRPAEPARRGEGAARVQAWLRMALRQALHGSRDGGSRSAPHRAGRPPGARVGCRRFLVFHSLWRSRLPRALALARRSISPARGSAGRSRKRPRRTRHGRPSVEDAARHVRPRDRTLRGGRGHSALRAGLLRRQRSGALHPAGDQGRSVRRRALAPGAPRNGHAARRPRIRPRRQARSRARLSRGLRQGAQGRRDARAAIGTEVSQGAAGAGGAARGRT